MKIKNILIILAALITIIPCRLFSQESKLPNEKIKPVLPDIGTWNAFLPMMDTKKKDGAAK